MDPAHGSKLFCRWFSRFFLIAASVVAFPALCFGAHKRRKFHFDLFAEGGGSLYQGAENTVNIVTTLTRTSSSTTTFLSTGTIEDSGRLFAGADFWFTRHDALEASYSYARADTSFTTIAFPTNPALPPQSFASSIGGHFLSFDYLRSFNLSGNWSLLLDAGIGAVWWKGPYIADRAFSANIGAGVSYRLTRHWAVRAEYRDYMEGFPFSGGAMLHDHAPTIGLVYRF